MEDVQNLREQLEKIDKQMLQALRKRFVLIKKMADVKCRLGLPIRDRQREEFLLNTYINHYTVEANDALYKNLVKVIFKNIFAFSRVKQKQYRRLIHDQ